jgi:hypothetical protein
VPIFNLRCDFCGTKKRVLRPQGWKPSADPIPCLGSSAQACGGLLERDPDASSVGTIVKESIDNGAQVRAVERFADAERLHGDRVEVEDALAKGKDPGRVIR